MLIQVTQLLFNDLGYFRTGSFFSHLATTFLLSFTLPLCPSFSFALCFFVFASGSFLSLFLLTACFFFRLLPLLGLLLFTEFTVRFGDWLLLTGLWLRNWLGDDLSIKTSARRKAHCGYRAGQPQTISEVVSGTGGANEAPSVVSFGHECECSI